MSYGDGGLNTIHHLSGHSHAYATYYLPSFLTAQQNHVVGRDRITACVFIIASHILVADVLVVHRS